MPWMPGAIVHPSPNCSPGRIGGHRGVVLHHIVGGIAAAESRFLSSNGGASAHFGTSYDGHIWQWVNTDDAAWHACQANYTGWVGIENESPSSGDLFPPLTDAQVDAVARILRWLRDVHGIPIRVAAGPGDSGLSYHSANPGSCSSAWGLTGCPGDAIINQRQHICDVANAVAPPDVLRHHGSEVMVIEEIDAGGSAIGWWLLSGAGITRLDHSNVSGISYAMLLAGVPGPVKLSRVTIDVLAQRIADTRAAANGLGDW